MEWFKLYCMVIFVDGLVPLSNIGGTGYVDDIETGTLVSIAWNSGESCLCLFIPIVLRHHPNVR